MWSRCCLLLACLLLASCWGGQRVTWVATDSGVSLTMELRPLPGWHRDWYRSLTLVTPQGEAKLALFEDTGWWRGSNLYEAGRGVWMLDEGQSGCVTIEADPPKLEDTSCGARATEPGGRSKSYESYRYLGQFSEGFGDEAPSFRDAATDPEVVLPEPL